MQQLNEQYQQHELIQSYFDEIYTSLNKDVQKMRPEDPNQIYGELYYYSALKLLKHLNLSPNDHFLDLGSGLGKLVLQLYLTSNIASVAGIEINQERNHIALKAMDKVKQKISSACDSALTSAFPSAFNSNRTINFIQGDF